MEVFEWEENTETTFGRRRNIGEGNNKPYSLFTDQCEPSPKTKIEGTKGYKNTHNAQDGIKLLEQIRSVVCGAEAHLQVT